MVSCHKLGSIFVFLGQQFVNIADIWGKERKQLLNLPLMLCCRNSVTIYHHRKYLTLMQVHVIWDGFIYQVLSRVISQMQTLRQTVKCKWLQHHKSSLNSVRYSHSTCRQTQVMKMALRQFYLRRVQEHELLKLPSSMTCRTLAIQLCCCCEPFSIWTGFVKCNVSGVTRVGVSRGWNWGCHPYFIFS